MWDYTDKVMDHFIKVFNDYKKQEREDMNYEEIN